MSKKIVYCGLCCRVRAKAAVIGECLRESEESRERIVCALAQLGERAGIFADTGVPGTKRCEISLQDEDQLEQIFDLIAQKDYRQRCAGQSMAGDFLLHPLLAMEDQEVRVESLGFFVYAMLNSSRCREALARYAQEEGAACYRAYRESAFWEMPLLSWFPIGQKLLAKTAVGLILRLRREESEGPCYRAFMEILYAGFRSLKNSVKRLRRITGDTLRGYVEPGSPVVLTLSKFLVILAMAEDMGIPFWPDYLFYVLLQNFQEYARQFQEIEGCPPCTEQERRRLKSLLKEHPGADSYCDIRYGKLPGSLEEKDWDLEELRVQAALERLFLQYRLHLQILSETRLEQREMENLFLLFGKLEWKDYRRLLLIASLCKYIQGLHQMMEENAPEELSYQREELQRACQKQLEAAREAAVQKERFGCRQRDLEEELIALRRECIKLQETLKQLKEERSREKEELIALRDFAFRLNEEPFCREEPFQGESLLKRIPGEQIIVAGGHDHWQKKMKQYFPKGQFLSADSSHFDPAVLHNKSYIILNTSLLRHACYYRIIASLKKDQRLLYVHGSNISKCLREIASQLYR